MGNEDSVHDRLRYLFGDGVFDVIDNYDVAEEADRMALVDDFAALPGDAQDRDARMAVRTVAVTQILNDDPPETWRTAQRLRDLGLDRDQVLGQLTMTIGQRLKEALADQQPFDVEAYVTALDQLPLPTGDEVARQLLEVARSRRGIDASDHWDSVVDSFGPGSSQNDAIASMTDWILEELLEGPLTMLAGDETLMVPDLVDGATFTHRFTEFEAELGALSMSLDYGALGRFEIVKLADGTELEPFSVDDGHLGWGGPDGWLGRFEPGDLLACTALVEASDDPAAPMAVTVTIDVVDEMFVDNDLVESVRNAYEREVAGLGAPVTGAELAWSVLYHHAGAFASAQLPLGELCTAAGLEVRGGSVADDESVWRRALLHDRMSHASALVFDAERRMMLHAALEVLDDPDADVDELRLCLEQCAEPETLDALGEVLIPADLELDDEFERGYTEAPGLVFDLVNRATSVAKRPREVATAQYLATVLYERCGEAEMAEQHLKLAADAQPRLGPIAERMGWYRFDRGDAKGAMKWWRTLRDRPDAVDEIEPFLAPGASGPKLGRNDPCWCGSGRKFKRCHQNVSALPALPALPDRVGWLCRKASLWLEHASGNLRSDVTELAAVRALGDPDAALYLNEAPGDEQDDLFDRVGDALADPIVFDAALHEDGLFKRFLHERGALLPDDEQLLAASWLTVDRSVHEVVSVDPGTGMVMRDLRSGEEVSVTERTLSGQADLGQRFCTRVVPDGVSHQIIGGVFPVQTGQEAAVMDMCAEGDAIELCAWVGALYQPPRVVHSPGMADAMFDREAIAAVLDGVGDGADHDETMAALGAEMSRQAMARWLDEEVPALGGVTPRQAADDPTRSEQLERLLDEFDDRATDLAGGEFMAITYDVPALRRELGLG